MTYNEIHIKEYVWPECLIRNWVLDVKLFPGPAKKVLHKPTYERNFWYRPLIFTHQLWIISEPNSISGVLSFGELFRRKCMKLQSAWMPLKMFACTYAFVTEYECLNISFVTFAMGRRMQFCLLTAKHQRMKTKRVSITSTAALKFIYVNRTSRTKWLSRCLACVSPLQHSCFFSNGIEIAGSMTIYCIISVILDVIAM